MSVGGRTHEENVCLQTYTHMNNEIFSCKKEANVIFSNTDEVEDILLKEISQTEKGQKKLWS